MPPMLALDAFGDLPSGTNLIDSEEEDLYSVFRARAELMGWSTTSGRRSLLWNMHQAELTVGVDKSRIGSVQVGLDVGDIEQTKNIAGRLFQVMVMRRLGCAGSPSSLPWCYRP